MEAPLDVTQARKDLAEKRKYAYKVRDRAAVKIQRWYRTRRSIKTELSTLHGSESGADNGSEQLSVSSSQESSVSSSNSTESGSGDALGHEYTTAQRQVEEASRKDNPPIKKDDSLSEFVNNEIAIAMALANQRSFSSLTESQQERVKQLRAEVSPHKEEDKQSKTQSNPAQRSNQKSECKQPGSQESRESLKGSRTSKSSDKGLQKGGNNDRRLKAPSIQVKHKSIQHEPLNGESDQHEQEQLLKEECQIHTEPASSHVQHADDFKKIKAQLVEQQRQSVLLKDKHTKKPSLPKPSQENYNTTMRSTASDKSKQTNKTKPLLQKYVIGYPRKQTKVHQQQTQETVRTQEAVKHSDTQTADLSPQSEQLLESNNRLDDSDTSEQSTQTMNGHRSRIPVLITKVALQQTPPHEKPSEIEQDKSKSENQLSVPLQTKTISLSKSKSGDAQTEWDEPATPEVSSTFMEKHGKDQNTPLPSNREEADDQNKRLSESEKAHALISYAQKLVINDFLAWKSESNITPITGNWTPLKTSQTNQHLTSSGEDHLYRKSNETQTDFTPNRIQLSPISQPPTQTTQQENQTSHPHTTIGWSSTSPSHLIDTAVQTDSEEESLSSIAVTPLPALHKVRPQGRGGQGTDHVNQRARKELMFEEANLIEFEEERRDFSKSVDQNVATGPRVMQGMKRSNTQYLTIPAQRDRLKKRGIRSLMSPTLKPSQKKQAGGYLSRYLHSEENGGHPQTKSAPGCYYQASPAHLSVPWHGGLNNTAPPSVITGESPLHMHRSHPMPAQIRRKLSGGSYRYQQRQHPQLRPLHPPPTNMYMELPPTNFLYNDPFQSLDSMYKHQYHSRKH